METAVDRFSRVDVLYANAGAARFGAIDEQPPSDWRFTLAAELESVFLSARAAWPHLKRNRGVIITVGSTAGIQGSVTTSAQLTPPPRAG